LQSVTQLGDQHILYHKYHTHIWSSCLFKEKNVTKRQYQLTIKLTNLDN